MNKEIIIKTKNEEIYITQEQFMILTLREREVAQLRFGLNGNEKHTYKKIGEIIFNITNPGNIVSASRVRQIVEKLLRKLRRSDRHIKHIWINE